MNQVAGTALGVLLVERIPVLVQIEDVSEDGEADRHLPLLTHSPDRCERDPSSRFARLAAAPVAR
ncbi:hypothetical protein AB0B39_12005 [Micromonospora sp. NPDC049114]|uniref:hypothetical protein n=1 Tax=unclassified Micromonospora TaxID=2617518 RepID=UPI0033D537F9